MKISVKLFLSFLGLTSVILIATLSLARWSFEQGFLDFIRGIETERLTRVSESLLEEYRASKNNWDTIQAQGLANFIDGQNKRRRPPADGPPRRNGPPGGNHKRPPKGHKGPPPPHVLKAGSSPRQNPPTALYSADGLWLSGHNPAQGQVPTNTLDLFQGTTLVGQLRSWPRTQQASPLASKFSRQQLYTSIIIGLGCLVLASVIALILSRILLGPLKRVLNSVAELSNGKYAVSFSESRSDELGKLMRDIEYLSNTLAQNRSAKSRWFADISHELRTPLTVLCGEIEAMKAGLRKFDTEQLLSIEQEVMLLKHLVDDLYQLSLSDVGGLRYNFTPIDLSQCIGTSVGTLQNSIEDKGLSLTMKYSGDMHMQADAKRIEQLMVNLISNSMAYTDAPGEIHIECRRVENNIEVSIDDTKPSISKHQCELIFSPLYRVDEARTRRGSGAGLGLSICKNIVEAHQGTITATPSKLGGLCITILLDIACQ